jgi:thiol-disulfide isomerase/thioredoxin
MFFNIFSMRYFKSALLVLIFFGYSKGFCQHKFVINITALGPVEVNKIRVSYDDGRKVTIEKKPFDQNTLNISDSFYSKFASLYLEYPEKGGTFFKVSFFIGQLPAHIVIRSKDSVSNPFQHLTVANAYDYINMGERKLKEFSSKSQRDVDEFYLKHGSVLQNNDSLTQIYLDKLTNLARKNIDFIEQNGNLYYSLWLFRTQIKNYTFISADSLLRIFKNAFSSKQRSTLEADYILSFLEAKINTGVDHFAPNFIAKDINGEQFSLSDYRSKFVILNFWATWCIPCLKEVPALQEISTSFPQVEIVSFSADTDSSAFAKTVKQYGMTWRHVYGSWPFKKIYIQTGIPQLYLLDKEGRVVYNSNQQKDNKDLSLLKSIIQKLIMD